MVYRKSAATEERREARKRTLLEAATRLFGEHGYHATTVPMIVEAAESSTGSFYLHFRNKEDVFAAVLEELGRKVLHVLMSAKEIEPDPVKATPHEMEALFLWFADNPDLARILIVESSGLSPRLEQVRREILHMHEVYVCGELQRQLQDNDSGDKREHPMILARCMVGAVFETVYSWLEEPVEKRLSAAEVARVVSDFHLRAMGHIC